ncbi:GntR family transcriptional regulator [Phycobacter sp. K97]|uniref:GntR family transcriptional regulator n=1 Tax=Phycobacter sedimenti TaxID=3133977 RepID=UPI00311E04A9
MKYATTDISKRDSAATIIFEALRKAIIEGDLQDGEPLRQEDIAKSFNTSRFPVREALNRLEQQGLVRTQRYKGAVVATLSMQEAGEVFDLRSRLEADVIRAAVPNMSTEVLTKAQEYLDRFAATDDPMHWGGLNRKFHGILYSASDMPYHIQVIENAIDRIDRYIRAQLVMSGGVARSTDEHRAILAACASGDAEEAARLTYAHIQDAKASLQRQLKAAT